MCVFFCFVYIFAIVYFCAFVIIGKLNTDIIEIKSEWNRTSINGRIACIDACSFIVSPIKKTYNKYHFYIFSAACLASFRLLLLLLFFYSSLITMPCVDQSLFRTQIFTCKQHTFFMYCSFGQFKSPKATRFGHLSARCMDAQLTQWQMGNWKSM